MIALPEKVKNIIHTLEAAGYEAYAVGGCVRDSLLGVEPKDWDITTLADPVSVKNLFHRTVDTGIKHGTVTVLIGNDSFEVTTYRIDGEYEDARHPKEVTFTKSLTEDLKRRDFTINAMAYNEEQGLVDLFGGCEDIRKQQLRCVGNPCERFHEDALRILRALRFSAQLGFQIEEKTTAAIRECAYLLPKISAERIREELNKILLSSHPEYLKKLTDYGIVPRILPELENFLTGEAAEQILQGLSVPEHNNSDHHTELILRWAIVLNAAWFSGIEPEETGGKPGIGVENKDSVADSEKRTQFVKGFLRGLKFDNDTILKAGRIAEYSTKDLETDAFSIRKLMHRMGEEVFDLWMIFLQGDRFPDGRGISESKILDALQTISGIRSAPYCISLKDLAINGADLMASGWKQGAEVGEALNQLLDRVLENPDLNRKDILLNLLRQS